MNKLIPVVLILVLVGGVVLFLSAYTIDETEQAIVVQFGRPVGDPIVEPGLHFKLPLVQEVRRFDKRFLSWDGDPNQVPTRGEQFISVDTTARWRISDPLTFLQRVQDERGAINRLNDILDSVVRDHISENELTEIVRSRDWRVTEEELETLAVDEEGDDLLREVRMGRQQLVADILATAQKQMSEYGIALEDIRIKRVDYVESVQERVFDRMISERQRMAEQFRSEGRGRAAEIEGQTERLHAEIISEAERQAEVIRGTADAEATRIYNDAFGADPEFYTFFRTLESYAESLGEDVTLLINADSEYFRYLGDIAPDAALPEPRPAEEAASRPEPPPRVVSPEVEALLEQATGSQEEGEEPSPASPEREPVEEDAEPEAQPEDEREEPESGA